MITELWNKILAFDLDNPPSEYGFSTRLANENYWTKDFTEQAILEYKKFMYLATSSEFMVSPSEIVDTVWHQHLIFTVSYQEFCDLIGKQIQHIPSTHNKEDFRKFKQAKERTTRLYESIFGNQPIAIWDYSDMFKSLNLEKANLKLRTFVNIGILIFISLAIPCYFLLKPIYITIHNPDFIYAFIALIVVTFMALELYNRTVLKQISKLFDKNSFIYSLQPFELVYLKSQKMSDVVNGVVNELIENKSIKINADDTIELEKNTNIQSKEQLQTTIVLADLGKTIYPTLLTLLSTKPIFWNIANSMDAFKKYFNKSKKFAQLFYLNFAILSLLLMLGFVRYSTGVLRNKPVVEIGIVIIALVIIIIVYLSRLTKLVCTQTIPNLYKTEILPTRKIIDNWQWDYFLFGAAVLTTAFAPIARNVDRTSDSGDSGGTSSDSSCGSSCSNCGGCGGD